MASLGRMVNALAVAHNENTLALVNSNFDFSLCRYDAPPEFRALGANISDQRREAAEVGPPYRTAQRLRALFDGVLPPIPELSRAYGQRVSEISESQKQNPVANTGGGPFADHMGADGTSIWAAATSRAIPILLLGSMLARIWSGPEATSLWVELVDRRRHEVKDINIGDSPSHLALRQAAQQDISRADLANWDASIRAWLQTADDVKQLQQTQLMIIINNLHLPVSSNMNVYHSVIESIKSALLSMEALLKGAAQRVQSGAFLLGLSAWHIYPDMIVHGSKIQEIKQNDLLVPVESIVTLGLQGDTETQSGVYWSLPLAHLRFYGDPIQRSRSTGYDASRVSADELVYIALGALFYGWFETSRESWRGLQWLRCLSGFFKRTPTTYPAVQDVDSQTGQPGWLSVFLNAAVNIEQLQGHEKERAMKLIALGHKRFNVMIEKRPSHSSPFFGLLEPSSLFPLLKTDEERIAVLRNFVATKKLDGREYVIRYRRTQLLMANRTTTTSRHTTISSHTFQTDYRSSYAFATAYPIVTKTTSTSAKARNQENRQKRWIAVAWDDVAGDENPKSQRTFLKMLQSKKYAVCKCTDGCASRCLCRDFPDGCLHECTCRGTPGTCVQETASHNSKMAKWLRRDIAAITNMGEICIDEHPRSFIDHCRQKAKVKVHEHSYSTDLETPRTYAKVFARDLGERYYDQPVVMRSMPYAMYDDIRTSYQEMWSGRSRTILHLRNAPWNANSLDDGPVSLVHRFGDPETAALYHVTKTSVESEEESDQSLHETGVQDLLSIDAVSAYCLGEYLECLEDNFVKSLKVLASIMSIYSDLPGATIAMQVAERPLHDSMAVPHQPKGKDQSISRLHDFDLAHKFACIALCEFGTHIIDPSSLKQVFALSSRNSIFVAAPLLNDPSQHSKEIKIRRVVGNIGRAGIAMMIAPQALRMRGLEIETWEQVNHAPFDGNMSDLFYNTSLHLSFTQYTLPISAGTHGGQDTETYLLESLVSIHDRERWVADVDVLKFLRSKRLHRYERDCTHCTHTWHQDARDDLIAIDNWEELLDREQLEFVVRAHGNPQARLATAIISTRQGFDAIIVSGDVCWLCVRHQFKGSATYIV